MNTEERRNSFRWHPYPPDIWTQLPKEFKELGELYEGADITLDFTIIPQHNDPKLHESIFIIQVFDSENEFIIYKGPFKRRLLVKSVPYYQAVVFFTFWAFHDKTQTSTCWDSKEHAWLFTGEQLQIRVQLQVELYDGYNQEADAWFKISPIQ